MRVQFETFLQLALHYSRSEFYCVLVYFLLHSNFIYCQVGLCITKKNNLLADLTLMDEYDLIPK